RRCVRTLRRLRAQIFPGDGNDRLLPEAHQSDPGGLEDRHRGPARAHPHRRVLGEVRRARPRPRRRQRPDGAAYAVIRESEGIVMFSFDIRVRHLAMGALLGVFSCVPAMADDAEIYMSQPPTDARPNVLFIMDTSGSMDTSVVLTPPP